MCQKQCRDQNGFKCHLMSESHQRQLLLFAENQKAYLREFSREFESNFMHVRIWLLAYFFEMLSKMDFEMLSLRMLQQRKLFRKKTFLKSKKEILFQH